VNLVNILEEGQGEHVNITNTLLVFRKNKKKAHFHCSLGCQPPGRYKFTTFTKFTLSKVAA
jgi:hypothetical protein